MSCCSLFKWCKVNVSNVPSALEYWKQFYHCYCHHLKAPINPKPWLSSVAEEGRGKGGGGGGWGIWMLPGWKWQVFPAEDNYYILNYGGVLGKKVHFCDQMVQKKRVKMSTGWCVESHGHLTKKMGGAFWVGHQSSKLQGFAPGGVRKVEALNWLTLKYHLYTFCWESNNIWKFETENKFTINKNWTFFDDIFPL